MRSNSNIASKEHLQAGNGLNWRIGRHDRVRETHRFCWTLSRNFKRLSDTFSSFREALTSVTPRSKNLPERIHHPECHADVIIRIKKKDKARKLAAGLVFCWEINTIRLNPNNSMVCANYAGLSVFLLISDKCILFE